MATPRWLWKMLELRGIPYEELHHCEAYTAQELAHREHVSGHRVAKVVVALADGHPVELVLPASRRVDFGKLGTILKARQVRLASEDEMAAFFADCEVGAAPPVRHWKGVDVLMDRSLTVEGDILFQAGTHQDAVRVKFRDWYELVCPQVATLSEPSEPARV